MSGTKPWDGQGPSGRAVCLGAVTGVAGTSWSWGACPLAARQDGWCLVAAQPGTRGPVGVLCPRLAWRRVTAGRGSAGRMEG